MSDLKLILGNKKYSSWSMRPWIAMAVKQVPFEDEVAIFDNATTHPHFAKFSPTQKVPVLQHGETTIWDSLAILEYVAELYPDRGFWPEDRLTRAHARSVANEMHSGFPALRAECPMNMARTPAAIELSDACRTDIARVETLFADCLQQYGGPFLFGAFTIADAMFAPVVNRIRVYKLSEHPAVEAFCSAIEALPEWQTWDAAGKAEEWIVDWVEV